MGDVLNTKNSNISQVQRVAESIFDVNVTSYENLGI